MTEIRSLSGINTDTLYNAWNNAFGGYVRTWTREELRSDLQRRGFVPQLSYGAFDGDALVSFTLNGVGTFNGQPTAYDTGTGTIPAYRGRGLASQIFEYSVPFLKEAGVTQYLLEVLQDNTTAINIYTKAGFKTTRGFSYFKQDNDKLTLKDASLPAGYSLRAINLSEKDAMDSLCDYHHAWQNSFESVARVQGTFVMLGVYKDDALVAYGITEPASGDITQLAVHKNYRRQGIGSALLAALLSHNKHTSTKVINMEESDNGITAFYEANGIPLRGKQYEMVKEL